MAPDVQSPRCGVMFLHNVDSGHEPCYLYEVVVVLG